MFAAAWIPLLFPLMLLHQGTALLLDPDCARDSPKAAHNPWMALVITDTQQCTGTLINNRHVITAAHCLKNTKKALVRLGDFTNPQQGSIMFEDFDIQTAIVHYKFSDKTKLNDIALLRLPRKVVYNRNIRPICLLLDEQTKKKTESVKTYASFLSGNTYEGPKKVAIQRFDPNQCYNAFWFAPRESQICGGSMERISCGESGSPLVKKMKLNGNEHLALLGFHTYGNWGTCVYTNVMSYVEWIVENVLDVKIIIPEIKN